MLVHLGVYFSSVSCGFFRDYTALGGIENAVASNMIEIGKFCLNPSKVVVFAKVQIHQKQS